MKKIIVQLFIISFVLSCSNNSEDFTYPKSKKINFTEILHGVEISDPYRWLEDFTSAESIDWINRQNNFTENFIKKNKYKENLENYLNKIWENESISTPFVVNGKIFYYFNDGTFQQSKLMIKDCEECKARVLIDPNTFSDDGTISLSGISVSNNASHAAFAISDGGSDWRTWKIININTGEIFEDEIKWAKFSGATWESDDSGFYYIKYRKPDEELLIEINESPQLMFHKVGTDQSDDILIYENSDKPRWSFGISVLKDSDIKVLSIFDGTDERNRIYLSLKKNGDFVPIIDDLFGAYNFIDSKDNILWFYTTENAPNGKVVNLEIKNNSFVWNEVISESKNAIRSVNIVNNSFVVNYLENTFSKISIFDLSGKLISKLSLPKEGTVSGFSGGIDESNSYFAISNYITPKEIYKIDLSNLSFELFWKDQLYGYNPNDYVSKLEFYKSKDGTEIPIHISHKKNLKIDETTPLLIYGYGGFNISILPNFSKSQTAWKNQNGVFAVANLRGGAEYGDAWHEAGMLFNKQNVFDDFAYAAKFLHSQNIGSPETTAIDGRSNGGLLVAATMLQNPDLFKVAIPQVGVLDMLRFNKFTIGWAWESDYGSSKNKDEFENLLAYSPFHNIQNVCYPTTLITTAERDDRVVPSHSFKFAARLQEKQACRNPILIRIETRAGHGSGTPKDKSINQIAEIYGYALKVIKS